MTDDNSPQPGAAMPQGGVAERTQSEAPETMERSEDARAEVPVNSGVASGIAPRRFPPRSTQSVRRFGG